MLVVSNLRAGARCLVVRNVVWEAGQGFTEERWTEGHSGTQRRRQSGAECHTAPKPLSGRLPGSNGGQRQRELEISKKPDPPFQFLLLSQLPFQFQPLMIRARQQFTTGFWESIVICSPAGVGLEIVDKLRIRDAALTLQKIIIMIFKWAFWQLQWPRICQSKLKQVCK